MAESSHRPHVDLARGGILPARKLAGLRGGAPLPELDGQNRPPRGLMKLTTLLFSALALLAEGKLTDADKLALARAESAAAKADAALTGTVAAAQRQIQALEADARAKAEARDKLAAELKKKLGLKESCAFDANQEPSCPKEEAKK